MEIVSNDYAWSTHQPLINAVVKDYKPEFVLELGIGNYSTPLFIDDDNELLKYIGIENDKEWIDLVKTNPIFSDIEIRHHLIGVDKAAFLRSVEDIVKINMYNYYTNLYFEIKNNYLYDFNNMTLFVDNFTCARQYALNILGSLFDIVMYHDCEPDGIKWYEYYFDSYYKNYNHYYLKTDKSWTGIFSKNELTLPSLNSFINKYQIENNASNIKLEKAGVTFK